MATIAQAIRLALHVGEEKLGVQDIFGEDVGPPLGGVFTCTQGLRNAWNSPLDERGIIGMATGLALAGQRPVAEIQFCDYIFNTIDLLKLAGGLRWSTNGMFELAMVVMTPVGAGIHGSLYHSHSFESMAAHMPGWKIVLPSNPRDVYGMLISSIQDPNPVLFLYPKALIRTATDDEIPGVPTTKELSAMIDAPPLDQRSGWTPKWPELSDFSIPLGKATTLSQGDRLTVLTYGRMVVVCQQALELMTDHQRAQVELIDLRSLVPLDMTTIVQSVQKTGRVLVVNEDTEVTNFGEHVIRRIIDECFYSLEAPPTLFASKNTPGVGLAQSLEQAMVPNKNAIAERMRSLLAVLT